MTIYPAIDLKGGRCVRLFQGKSDQETVYFNNPIDPAREWRNLGATHLHLVDLDGAFSGGSENLNAVESILSIGGMKVQLGGGMRNDEAISKAFDLGLHRIIVGTSACENPSWVGQLIKKYGPERIVVGIDARDGWVATKGWVEISQISALQFAGEMQSQGARWIIHTDVATDGAMKGPNLSAQAKMAETAPKCKIIASGGVSTEKDVKDLRELANKYENLEGIIIGKALYEKTIRLDQLISEA
ncbi:MAG: 1-(5-phosphoribosyl)-5-[(5-phosphoribosylamino)methylideneamino]imidazole-4-carboxamide isomerase [Opitutae bacterium]